MLPDATTEPLKQQLTQIIRQRIETDRLVIPTMPAVATKCLGMLKDPKYDVKKLVAALETDPVFAAQITRAASTAAFGGQPVRSLEAAINRLGTNQMRTVLTQAAARSLFETSNKAIAGRLALLWKHSVAVAVLARDVGALMQLEDAQVVYLAGLLHDVGKTVVAAMLLEAESALAKKGAWISADQWIEVVDATHREIGVLLAERWNLDPELIEAIRDCSEFNAGYRKSPANVVRFCNALAKTQAIAVGNVDQEDAKALVMIGRSMLDVDEDVVKRLAQGLKERVDGLVTLAW